MNPKMMTCKIMDGNRKDVPMVNPIIVARPRMRMNLAQKLETHETVVPKVLHGS